MRLNLEDAPALRLILESTTGASWILRQKVRQELDQLVERERVCAVAEAEGRELDQEHEALPEWAKPAMRAVVGYVELPCGTTAAEWDDAMIRAVDDLSEEQLKEIKSK